MKQDIIGQFLSEQYMVEEHIISNSVWSIYLAWDVKRQAPLILKALHPELAENPSKLALLRENVNKLSRVDHPNICTYLAWCQDHGLAFTIQPFINGVSVNQILRRPKKQDLVIRDYLSYVKTISKALDFLHARQIIHGDLNPENIQVDIQGCIYLTGFNITDRVFPIQAREVTRYMPREQVRGEALSPAVDIFALGEVVSEMVGTQAGLTDVLAKASAVDPEHRYHKAGDFFLAVCDAAGLQPEEISDTSTAPAVMSGGQIVALPRYTLVHTQMLETAQHTEVIDLPVSPKVDRKISVPAMLLGIISILAVCAVALLGILGGGVVAGRGPGLTATPNPLAAIANLSPTLTQSPSASPTLVPTLTLTITLTPTITQTAIGGGRRGVVAYASVKTGSAQIFLMDPDGKQVKQLTNMDGGACQPDWSPDGQQIVFISPCEGSKPFESYANTNLFTMNVDGTNISALPLDVAGGNFDPAWSPEGSLIAFVSVGRVATDKLPHLYVYNLNTRKFSGIYTNLAARKPSWSPYSNQIVFENPSFKQIWIVSLDTKIQPVLFSSSSYNAYSPTWSPDGKFIIFGQQRFPMLVFKSLENISGNETVITKTTVTRPAWNVDFSSDGKWIMYVSKESEIYRYMLNGDEWDLQQVAYGFHPAWSP